MTQVADKDDDLLENETGSLLHRILIDHMAKNSKPLEPERRALTTKELIALRDKNGNNS